MLRSNPWQSYQKVATQTASPGQLVLMLYEGAIRFLDRSLEGFSAEDPLILNQTVGNNILKAQAIIDELNGSLDLAQGGEFALNLRRLYNYFDRRLQESNIQKRPDGVREVIARLTVLRDSWHEMLRERAAVPSSTIPAEPAATAA